MRIFPDIWPLSAKERESFANITPFFRVPRCDLFFLTPFFIVALFLLIATPALADEITTVDGKQVSGSIVSEDDSLVRIRTTRGLMVDLPQARIKSIIRKSISLLENAGDLALEVKNYEKALSLYRRAQDEDPSLKAIETKIARVLGLIDTRENALYEDLFQNALNDAANDDSAQAIKRLGEIALKATPGGTWERKARRALAYEYFKNGLRFIDRLAFNEAIGSMESAIQADSTLAAPYLEYAQLLQKRSNQKMKALKAYNQGLSIAQAETEKSADENILKSYAPPEARLTEDKLTLYRFEMATLMADMGNNADAAEILLILLEKFHLPARQKKIAEEFVLDMCGEPRAMTPPERVWSLASLNRMLKVDPQSVRAFTLKGHLLLLENKTAEGISCLSQAVTLAPESPGIRLLRAQGLVQLKKWDMARKDLEAELALNPTYDTMCQLADVEVEMLDFQAALEQYELATEMAPGDIRSRLGHARAVRIKANFLAATPAEKTALFVQADSEFDELLKQYPGRPEILLEKGLLAYDAERFDEAAVHLSKATSTLESIGTASVNGLSREDREVLVKVYHLLGRTYLTLKKFHEALDELSKALLLQDMPLGPIHQTLGEVEQTRGNSVAAVEHFENAIKAEPLVADHELRLAILFHQFLKKPTEAIPHYEAFLTKGGKDDRVETRLRACRIATEGDVVNEDAASTTTGIANGL